MLRKYIAPLVCLCLLLSCKDEKQYAEEAIRKSILDNAFKENKKATIHELKVVEVKPESAQVIRERQIGYLTNMVSIYTTLYSTQVDMAASSARQMKLYAMLDSKTLIENERDNAKQELEDANKYKDTLMMYKAIYDSLDKKKIDTTVKDYYHIKCFLKVTVGEENALDTFYYIANKKWEILNPVSEVVIN